MNLPFQAHQHSSIAIQEENARFMSKVYSWMCGGILLSGSVAHFVASSPEASAMVLGNRIIFFGLIIAQLAAVFSFSMLLKKISASAATLLYLSYCALSGMTLSVIFLVYTQQSILNVFAITAFSFGGLSAFGYFTKKDLGPLGAFCMMGLFGLLGYYLISLFFPSMMGEKAQKITGIIGVIIFAGLTAYDTQKIKASNILGNEGTDEDKKEAIHGALILYLDFINLFLHLLRLMGRRR